MNGFATWQKDLAQAIGSNAIDPLNIEGMVCDSGMTPQEGLAIYRNNCLSSRARALESVYPVCRRLIGSESFDGLAREFTRRYPSTNPDLNLFGDGLAGLVEEVTRNHTVFGHLPWLPDLVRLEWLCHKVYYQADDPPLDLSKLDVNETHRLYPRPSSCIAWLRISWSVHEIWAAHQADSEPPAMHVEEGEWCLVIERRKYQPHPLTSDQNTLDLLDACANGVTLDEITSNPRVNADYLGELMLRGWIGSLECRNHDV